MEVALILSYITIELRCSEVSILVFMEVALIQGLEIPSSQSISVSILVFMEVALILTKSILFFGNVTFQSLFLWKWL